MSILSFYLFYSQYFLCARVNKIFILIIMNNRKTTFAIFAILFVLFSSCRTYKDQTGFSYVLSENNEIVQSLSKPYSLRIKPDDELKINISSTVLQATSQFNLPAVNYVGRSDTQLSTTGAIATYTVSESGHIVIPSIGKLFVSGLTPEEVSELIKEKISETVSDPIVKVDLKNFHIIVLGSVSSPGTKSFSGQRCSIFDAIGAAGDITLHGRKDNVVLMRECNGYIEKHVLDLTDAAILESPYYYLQQNDVLVVDATDVSKENSTYNTMNSFKLQTTSTIVSAASVIASLLIALLIK